MKAKNMGAENSPIFFTPPSLNFKNVSNQSEGGVSIFQKCLKFKNVPNVGGGGGGNPNWDIVPNFTVFFSDASPKVACLSRSELGTAKPQLVSNPYSKQAAF